MANYCACDLGVWGPEDDVAAFLDFAKTEDSDLDFNKFIPEAHDCEHHWHSENWGTSSEASDVEIDAAKPYCSEGWSVLIKFETAWTPPIKVIMAASLMFSSLEFDLRYYESGAGFHGAYIVQGGEVIRDQEGPYYGPRGG